MILFVLFVCVLVNNPRSNSFCTGILKVLYLPILLYGHFSRLASHGLKLL